jgi:hypothetical protein
MCIPALFQKIRSMILGYWWMISLFPGYPRQNGIISWNGQCKRKSWLIHSQQKGLSASFDFHKDLKKNSKLFNTFNSLISSKRMRPGWAFSLIMSEMNFTNGKYSQQGNLCLVHHLTNRNCPRRSEHSTNLSVRGKFGHQLPESWDFSSRYSNSFSLSFESKWNMGWQECQRPP